MERSAIYICGLVVASANRWECVELSGHQEHDNPSSPREGGFFYAQYELDADSRPDMQTFFDIAADLDTPVSAYLKLAPFKPRFLLESVEGGTRVGRYSFIGFGESLEARLTASGMRVNGEERPRPANQQEFLDALRKLLADTPVLRPDDADVPFRGGLVGVMGYDIVRLFESLPVLTDKHTDLPEAAFVAPQSMLVFDHLTRRAGLLHAGSETTRQALRNNVVAAMRGPVPETGRGAGEFSAPSASMEQSEFEDKVRWAQEQIAAGEVFQLVLSVCFSGATDIDPFLVYRALRLLNPSPYMYFFDLGDAQVVGSSPEALVRLQEGVASLRPIAGTRPRGTDSHSDENHANELLADPKENAEHVMLVDLARNDLGRVAVPGSINVNPYRVIERYSHVMHLVSGVQGKVEKQFDAFDLFASAFPAGTLVGAPKVRAMELIEQAEPARRDFYAGTVGYFDHDGNMDQAIAIRTIVFHQNQYRFQAGAGIVADSVPRTEYQEVVHKSNILRQALAMARDGL
ncbi:MAG: anthranilate synthase component I family protein [Gammaproteobacteria bacterium]|nr:anthranilate synthase component I family protein [Gammaproteobacteria bacterium]